MPERSPAAALHPDRRAAGLAADLFAGPGEMRDRCRTLDWATTSLGPVDDWSSALRTAIRLGLDAAFPACLYAGPELVLVYNDLWRPWLGTSRHPTALGRPAREVWADRWTRLAPDLTGVLAGGPPILRTEQRVVVERGTGSEEAFYTHAFSPVRDEAGAVIAVHNVAFETTEQVLAARARTQADEASRAKSAFLATMSHEFRTPLNAILGYAQLLDMGVLGATTPAQHAHLERLQASARHLLGLVDDVLDVAKVDADRLRVRRDALLTGPAVAAAVTLVQPQATAKGVTLVDLGAGDPGVAYIGDEHRVRQILVNLLANAVKFTPAGGQITVDCGSADEPEPGVWRPSVPKGAGDGSGPSTAAPTGWAYVKVEDTGPGIAPELLPRLFEPFVQGNGALTREQGGTGLGLAISRRLARLMGGDLTVRSQPGHAAIFTLWLPGNQRPAALGAAPTRQRPARGTPALGRIAIGTESAEPLDPSAYAVLHALGVRLASEAETVAERYVVALRADGRFPGARELPVVQLRDHATPDIGLLATRLMIIGETQGRAPELLGDGAQVQRRMAELHGAQRYRLGWSETDIEREVSLLLAEVERAIRAALEAGTATGVVNGRRPEELGIDGGAVRAAASYALELVQTMVEESRRTAIRAYRFARASDTP